jgi:hypothetical protein
VVYRYDEKPCNFHKSFVLLLFNGVHNLPDQRLNIPAIMMAARKGYYLYLACPNAVCWK